MNKSSLLISWLTSSRPYSMGTSLSASTPSLGLNTQSQYLKLLKEGLPKGKALPLLSPRYFDSILELLVVSLGSYRLAYQGKSIRVRYKVNKTAPKMLIVGH